jgi:hypothetical protein
MTMGLKTNTILNAKDRYSLYLSNQIFLTITRALTSKEMTEETLASCYEVCKVYHGGERGKMCQKEPTHTFITFHGSVS